jgi:peptide-methionine (R)-S-oxide reductase
MPGEAITRRKLLGYSAAGVGTAMFGGTAMLGPTARAAAPERFEIVRTPEQWRRILTPAQYAVLREEATERAGSSPLNREHRRGLFLCAGCNLPRFSSAAKFESGTGWPSFYQPIEGNVGKTEDRTFGMVRTEVHCRRCGGHLGHVFDDGPKPTGLRYCIDGFGLVFHPAAASAT